ncbi:MAG: heparinase II/III family protein [Vicinamibacteria bacterium]|nr:heparinase II/III family protein [Vicinamibacteria bacterium]
MPEWSLDSGHAHPDAGSFIIYANGRYLTGDTGYAGLPTARNHNTVTFGGIGQGVEGDHDVWRGAPYAGFDGIRIRGVKANGPGVTIEAELAAAYPKVAELQAFTRTFSFDGNATFSVSDSVTLKTPTSIEWRLQSDTPFMRNPTGEYRNGGKSGPALEVTIAEPKNAEVELAVGKLKVPGPPGSITTGAMEDRGYVLTATAKASAGESRVEATIRIVK